MKSVVTAAILSVAINASLWGQVAVQQPVVGTFGGSTTVSVPDRGSTHLGSVNSARSGRTTTGPFRSGSSLGSEVQGSSMSVGVFIHDLQAMDEAILGMAGPSLEDTSPHAGRLAARRAGQPAIAPPVAPVRIDTAAQLAKFERLAREAEAKGKPSVARLHWQMAAKYGSSVAATKLSALTARK